MAGKRLPNIFEYRSPGVYLMDAHEMMRERNPHYSVRSWAKSLKLNNPTTLFRALKDERRIPVKLISEISRSLALSQYEAAYLEVLSVGHRKFSEPTFEFLQQMLQAAYEAESKSL